MKKVYTRPEIMFESFTLSYAIAGDCESIVGNPAKGTCGVPGSDGENLFSSTVTGADGCEFDWAALYGDSYNGFCYDVPTEGHTLFNS